MVTCAWLGTKESGCLTARILPSLPRFPARVHVLCCLCLQSLNNRKYAHPLLQTGRRRCTSFQVGCVTLPRWRSRRLQPPSSYLRSEVWKGLWQYGSIDSIWPARRWPCAHAPVCQPDTCPMPTQAQTRHPSSWHLPFPSLWPPVVIIAALSGIQPSPVATGYSPTPPSLPIRLQVC